MSMSSFTVWVYSSDNAAHHDNNLAENTYADCRQASRVARALVSETPHNTGYSKIVDNNIAGKMGDHGLIAMFHKDKNGRIYRSHVRPGFQRFVKPGA